MSAAGQPIFRQFFEDDQESAQSNCIQLNARSSGTQTLNFYGNTIDQDTDVPNGTSNPFLLINGCQVGMWGTSGGNSFGIPWTGPILAANNHLIGLSSLADLFVSRSAGTSFPITDNGGEVIMSTATARAENYCATLNSPCTVVNDDAPSTLSSGTVGQGTNQSAQILRSRLIHSDLLPMQQVAGRRWFPSSAAMPQSIRPSTRTRAPPLGMWGFPVRTDRNSSTSTRTISIAQPWAARRPGERPMGLQRCP